MPPQNRSYSLTNNKYQEKSTNIVKSELSLYALSSATPTSRLNVLDAKSSDSKNLSLSSYNLNRSSSNTPQTSVTTSENHESKLDSELSHESRDLETPFPTCLSLESIREGAAKASDYIADSCPNPHGEVAKSLRKLDLDSDLELERSPSSSSFTSAEYGDAHEEGLEPSASKVHEQQHWSSVHEETHSGNGSSPMDSLENSSTSSSEHFLPQTTPDHHNIEIDDTASSTHSGANDRTVFTTPTNDNTDTSAATSISNSEEEKNNLKEIFLTGPTTAMKPYKSMLLDESADENNSTVEAQGDNSQGEATLADLKHQPSVSTSLQDSAITLSQNANTSSETLATKPRPRPVNTDTSKSVNLDEELFTPCSEYSFAAGEDKLICKPNLEDGDGNGPIVEEDQSPKQRTSNIKREKTDASISHILDAYSETPAQEPERDGDPTSTAHGSQLHEPQELAVIESPKLTEVLPGVIESPEAGQSSIEKDKVESLKESAPVQLAPNTGDIETVKTELERFESAEPEPQPVVNKEEKAEKDNELTGKIIEQQALKPIELSLSDTLAEREQEFANEAEEASGKTTQETTKEPLLPSELGNESESPAWEQSNNEMSKKPPPTSLNSSPVKNLVGKEHENNNASLIRNRLSMLNVVNVDFDKSLPTTPDKMNFTVAVPDTPTSKKLILPDRKQPQLQRTNSMTKSFSMNNFKKVFSRSTKNSGDSKKEVFGSILRLKPSGPTNTDDRQNMSTFTHSNLSSASISTSSSKKSKRKFFKTIKILPGSKQEEVTSPVYSVRAKVPSPVIENFQEDTQTPNLYSLPAFEAEEGGFDDVLLKFDEVEKELENEQLANKPKANAFFLKDDELTRAQIADQQRKDNLNSDESLPEKLAESSSEDTEELPEPLIAECLKSEQDLPWSPGYDDYAAGSLSVDVVDEGPKRVRSIKLDKSQLQDMLDDKAHSNHFIKHVKQMRDMELVEIVVEAFNPHEKREDSSPPLAKVMNSILKDGSVPNESSSKAVKFSSKVSISETYPSYVYRRYNKSVTQYYLTETREVNKIKNELNAYKCYEMLVHEKSQNNTQFFY